MPRSGTSLIARALNIMGVQLGPEEHMLEPTASNPKGYWEQQEINALNDAILSVFGGSFERPPDLPPGWQNDPALDPLRARAAELLGEYFGDAPLWGFKDPRNSVTQQFWRELVPGMAAVLCVRAPEDVATSWQRHDRGVNGLEWNELLSVWLHYNAAALVGTSGAPRLVVSQERFLAEPRYEVRRLATFLTAIGAPPDGKAVGEAERSVDRALVHHHTDPRESLEDERVPRATRSLYGVLLDLAGDKPPSPQEPEAVAAELWRTHRHPDPSLQHTPGPDNASPFRRVRRKLRAAAEPAASLDWPADGAVLNRNDVWVWGRAAFPDVATARVLVAVDGGPPMRARLAVPRDDIPGRDEGFELLVPPRSLPAGVDEVEIAVTAVSVDDATIDLGRRRVQLEAPQRGTDQNDRRAAALRERVVVAGRGRESHADRVLAVASNLFDKPGRREGGLDLVSRLGSRGYDITVAASIDRSLRQRFEGVGARVHTGATVPLASAETYEARLAELAGWLSVEGTGAVLAEGIDSFPLVDLAQRLGIRNVWLLQEAVELERMWIMRGLAGPECEYARERAYAALRECDATVFPSRASRDVYRAYSRQERAAIVPPPVDADRSDSFRAAVDRGEIRTALGVPAGATLVFVPGGGAALLSAIQEVNKRRPDIHVVSGGSGLHLYEAADVVVVDGDPEDVPFACLRAMALHKPVVASRTAGADEEIEDGVDGWLYDSNDVGQLIDRLLRAMEMSPAEQRSMGARAADRVRERHQPEALAEIVARALSGTPILHAPCSGSRRASTAQF